MTEQTGHYVIEAAMENSGSGILDLKVFRNVETDNSVRPVGTVVIRDWAYARKELPGDQGEISFSERVDFFRATLCKKQEDDGKITYEEMVELVFEYLCQRGVKYVDTWVYEENMDWCERKMGFQLIDRDTSGWEPKYIYTRELG